MKTMIIYFSFSGNNKALAETLGTELSYDVMQLQETKKRRSFTFIKDLMSKKLPTLKNDLKVLDNYEMVLLIAPVWFGKLAAPMIPVIQYLEKMGIPYDLITLRGGQGDDTKTIMESITTKSIHQPSHFYDFHIVDYSDGTETDVRKIKMDKSHIRTITNNLLEIYKGA